MHLEKQSYFDCLFIFGVFRISYLPPNISAHYHMVIRDTCFEINENFIRWKTINLLYMKSNR